MSNRQSVLIALEKHGKSTYLDLDDSTGLSRDKLRQAVSDAKKADHVTVSKDEITQQPAYTITPTGKAWLKQQSVAKPAVKGSLTVEKPVASAKPATEESSVAGAQKEIDAEVRLTAAGKGIIDFCEWLAKQTKVRCPLNLHECKKVITDALKGVEYPEIEAMARDQATEIKALKAGVAKINDALELDPEDGGADTILSAITEISTMLTEETAEVTRLTAENCALKILNESMPGFGAAHAGLTKGPFVVRIPGKPAVFANKYDNAKAAAMSAARQKQGGEVFALIPVGKAIRGAEWKTQ